MLKELAFPGMDSHRFRSIEAAEGTFAWILRDCDALYADVRMEHNVVRQSLQRSMANEALKLQIWLRSPTDRNIFWIHGKAGAGKSTILKLLSEHELTVDWAYDGIPFAPEAVVSKFFALRAGRPLEHSLTGL